VIDEHTAGHLSSHSQEVGPALPVGPILVDQPQIGLMNQGSGGDCVLGALSQQQPFGQRPQLVVDGR